MRRSDYRPGPEHTCMACGEDFEPKETRGGFKGYYCPPCLRRFNKTGSHEGEEDR